MMMVYFIGDGGGLRIEACDLEWVVMARTFDGEGQT